MDANLVSATSAGEGGDKRIKIGGGILEIVFDLIESGGGPAAGKDAMTFAIPRETTNGSLNLTLGRYQLAMKKTGVGFLGLS